MSEISTGSKTQSEVEALSPKLRAAILEEAQSEAIDTLNELGQRFPNVRSRAIRHILKAAGINLPDSRERADRNRLILQMSQDGMTHREIAKAIVDAGGAPISKSRVGQIINETKQRLNRTSAA